MEERLNKIRSFAEHAHGDQMRRYSDEKYIRHPERVMELCREHTQDHTILAAALLHDVLEDTEVTEQEIASFLIEVMETYEAERTVRLVVDLTDIYIKKDYPHLNRKKRKRKEAERLGKAHPDAQTVKYADIIDNTVDLAENDEDFARVFLKEAQLILSKMHDGHPGLRKKARETVEHYSSLVF
ncbi:metal dependent phosphohydrolase [Fulvivirga imtechensis AK7]|uniref:Metal dependent phosphohydrolase n=1 Tax=Fulvivirga imtechensis AK7 TaxID=1237149 RepID=L8JM88_9BACT|nr:HD domain-containing protein [Fulvivirga imtechensis]ELR68639.1 metal dependent phosphohydrolase [Fulvivirga imtechensis AK7]